MRKPEELFSCVTATGIAFCDKSREVHGDYKKIAHLFFSDLRLNIYAPRSKLLPKIEEQVRELRAKAGQQYQVSSSGQTVILGGG